MRGFQVKYFHEHRTIHCIKLLTFENLIKNIYNTW